MCLSIGKRNAIVLLAKIVHVFGCRIPAADHQHRLVLNLLRRHIKEKALLKCWWQPIFFRLIWAAEYSDRTREYSAFIDTLRRFHPKTGPLVPFPSLHPVNLGVELNVDVIVADDLIEKLKRLWLSHISNAQQPFASGGETFIVRRSQLFLGIELPDC